jgi:signal transduction histidine kinase/CheY-like chemotaxis protein
MKKKHLISDIASASMLFIVISLCFFVAWRSYRVQVDESQESQVQLMGDLVKDRFSRIIQQNIFTLQNLSERIQQTEGDYFKYWKSEVGFIIKQNPSFKFVEHIDSNMLIQDVVPINDNEKAIGLNIAQISYRKAAWIFKSKNRKTNVTPWVKLKQGGEAFLVDEPIYVNNKFWGTMTAGLDFRKQIDEIFEVRTGFHMHLHDQKDYLFYCSSPEQCAPITVDSSLIYMQALDFEGMEGIKWEMQLYPTREFFDGQADLANLVGFILSVVLSAALSVAFFFILSNSRQKRLASRANKRLKELNFNLDSEKKRAEEASKIKSQFLSNMSHEIRTPINVMYGLIEVIKQTNLDPEQKQQVELLDSSSKNLLGLVNNVLEIESIESGKISLVKHAFQPLKRISSLVKTFENSFTERGLYLQLEDKTNKKTASLLIGDEVKIGQIVSNLIRNAAKFTKEGGVTVVYEEIKENQDNVDLKITVSDTGIGIPKERLNEIFDRFTQVETGYTKKFEGSGLGLSIARNLAILHGGKVNVESAVGKGTSFIVHIPMMISNKHAETNKSTEVNPEKFKGKKILIVEDNELNVMVLQKMLSKYDFDFETAENGSVGLNLALAQPFDLILMDIHMPIMDGIESSKRIREAGIDTPIIGLSANITRETMVEALDSGMKAYLTKPYSKDQILEVFAAYLN